MKMMFYIDRLSDTAAKAAAMVDILSIASTGDSVIPDETLAWYNSALAGLLSQIREDADRMTQEAAASSTD